METFRIFFDGGTSKGGDGYGSWEVIWNGFSKKVSKAKFSAKEIGCIITNNVAEYQSLIEALAWLKSVQDKKNYEVVIHGDSQLVLYQITGRYKTKVHHLKRFKALCRDLLKEFGDWKTEWRPRINNVQRFGH